MQQVTAANASSITSVLLASTYLLPFTIKTIGITCCPQYIDEHQALKVISRWKTDSNENNCPAKLVSQAMLQPSVLMCQLEHASSGDYSTHDWSTSNQANQSEHNTDYRVIEEAHGLRLMERVVFWQCQKRKKGRPREKLH